MFASFIGKPPEYRPAMEGGLARQGSKQLPGPSNAKALLLKHFVFAKSLRLGDIHGLSFDSCWVGFGLTSIP